MAITLEVSADMEALLNRLAAENEQDVSAYLLKLVENSLRMETDLSDFDGLEDYASSVAAIQEGLDDADAGRTYSMEEVFARGRAGRETVG